MAVTALAEGVIQMMWLARLKPLAAALAALILATAGVAVQGRQQPAPEGAREQPKTAPPPADGTGAAAVPDLAANRALAREQLALIDQARDMLQRLYQNGRAEYSSFAVWDRRKLESLRRMGAGKAEIIAALEQHIAIVKAEEKIAQALVASAKGTEMDVLEARYRRMEAEIWLNEEKAR
jgi:hypothetical protein